MNEWDDFTDAMISDVLKRFPNFIKKIPKERLTDKMIKDVFYTCDIDTLRWIYVYNSTYDKHIFSDRFIIDYIKYRQSRQV